MKKSDEALLKALKENPELLKQLKSEIQTSSKAKSAKRYDSSGKVLKDGESEYQNSHRFCFRWTDSQNKRHAVYATDLDSLRRKERQIQKDMEEGIQTNEADSITVGMVWNDFYSMKKDKIKGKTLVDYVALHDKYLVKIKDEKIRSFHYKDIVSFYQEVIEEAGCSLGTIQKLHVILSGMFELCIKNQYISINPCKDALKAVKDMCKPKKKRESLTVEEQTRILEFIADSEEFKHWMPIVMFALSTGMRMSEICGLTWDDIDFRKNEIHVNHQLLYYKAVGENKMSFHLQDTKTEAGKRIIPMLTEARLALIQAKDFQKEYGLQSPSITGIVNHERITVSGFCFLNTNSTPYTVNGIDCSFRRILKTYNAQEEENAKEEGRKPVLIKSFSSHVLRHTFSTRLAEADINIKVHQEIMGHENIQTTMNIYTDAQPKKIHEEIEKNASKIKLS